MLVLDIGTRDGGPAHRGTTAVKSLDGGPAIRTATGTIDAGPGRRPLVPVRILSTGDILYGDRVTSYRWEVLTHAGGIDTLAGYLDGVIESSATLNWSLYSAVKGSGSLRVADLAAAQPGFLRIGQIALASARIRPVLVVEGLPEIPLGVYLLSAAPEQWSGSGREYSLELLDRTTVLDQDRVEVSYTVAASTAILSAVATVIASAGESITVDATVTATPSSAMVWEAGTSKLQIVNDLLAALNYNALWVDGGGNYRATPYVVPASRTIQYELLNLDRELVDGDTSIYSDEWSRDRDLFEVPNKVITVQSGTGDTAPLTGTATNTDASSPFSYANRGNRWISKVITGVETPAGTTPQMQAYLDAKARASLIASSAVQAAVQVKHLPIPVRVSDVLRFANAPAGIDKRHVLTSLALEAHPLGLMTSTLQEVIEL